MATKAQIQTKINSIADGEENTAEEVREFANGLLDEMWNAPIYETDSTNTITSRLNTNITYAINFTKQGNIVHLQGTITTIDFGVFTPNIDLIAITETEYLPTNSTVQRFKKDGAIFRINNSKITAITTLTLGTTYYIDLAYVTD